MKLNYTLCEFSECPLCDKCARYLPELDKKEVNHFAWNPYDEKRKRCAFFEPYEDVKVDESILNNILERIKVLQDAEDNNHAKI